MRFTGRLDNQPRTVRHVKMGDQITFTLNEIVDWTYIERGKTKGNYSARAILKSAPPAERDAFGKRFGLDLDF